MGTPQKGSSPDTDLSRVLPARRHHHYSALVAKGDLASRLGRLFPFWRQSWADDHQFTSRIMPPERFAFRSTRTRVIGMAPTRGYFCAESTGSGSHPRVLLRGEYFCAQLSRQRFRRLPPEGTSARRVLLRATFRQHFRELVHDPPSPSRATFDATLSGGCVTATPKHFFRDDGGMPDVINLRMARPHGFEKLEPSEWSKLITERLRAKEADHRQRRAVQGITVLGRERVLRQKPSDCPSRLAPRFQMSPQVAAKNKWARIEALLRNRGFIERCRAAFLAHVSGLADVLFPYGSYWMRKVAKVACEAAEVVEATTQDLAANPAPA